MMIRRGVGAIPSIKLVSPVQVQQVPSGNPVATGGGIPTVVIVAGLGVGAFLLYRHFKNKGASTPEG